MHTIEKALDTNNGVGPGFDLLRLGLAIAILFIHCFPLATGQTEVFGLQNIAHGVDPAGNAGPSFQLADWIKDTFFHKHNEDAHFANVFVPMFFALSGFLVSGSAFRLRSAGKFFTFRALRIVPALFVEVSLSALVLGPLVTAYTLQNYFSDPKLFEYFGNIVGRIRFLLPGVFLDNPTNGIVNANLWTLPAEFYCYLIISALLITGTLFARKTFTILFLVGAASWVGFDAMFRGLYASDIQRGTVIAVVFFFCGALLFQYRERIPLKFPLFLLAILLAYLNIIAVPKIHDWIQYPAILGLTYVTIFLGFTKFPDIPLLLDGDYSYGIYLYGYPISQALIFSLPSIKGKPLVLFAIGLSATLLFAVLSWHFFEKPALKLKRLLLRSPSIAQTV